MSKDKSFEMLLVKAIKGVLMQNVEDANLFIARTGVGKSTLINYLLGCVMKYIKIDGDDRVVVDHCFGRTDLAGIGQEVASYTLFPSIYYTKDKERKKLFIDFPGTEGTRERDVAMLEMLVTQVAIKAINSVKSIIVPMPYYELQDPKLVSVTNIITPIAKMFKEPMKHRDSIRLVVTHVPKNKRITKATVITKLSKLREHINKKIQNEDTEENQNMIIILDYLINNQESVFIFNPLSGDTRKELFASINNVESFSSSEMNIVAADDIKNKFIERVDEILHNGNNVFNHLMTLPKDIHEETERKNALSEAVKALEIKVRSIKDTHSEKENVDERLKDLEAAIKQRESQIEDIQKKINPIETKIGQLRLSIDNLNKKTDLVTYETIKWSESEAFGGKVNQRTVVPKLLQWSGPPYSSVTIRNGVSACSLGGSSGNFENGSEKLDASGGKYEIKYIGPENCFGYVEIDIKMEHRNLPKIKSMLSKFAAELDDKIKEHDRLKAEVELLKSENAKVRTIVAQTSAHLVVSDEENKRLVLQAEQLELENKSAELARIVAHLDKLIKSNESYKQEFIDNRVIYQVLIEYNNRIGFESDKFKMFIEQHPEVLKLLNFVPINWDDIKIPEDPTEANSAEKIKENFVGFCSQCDADEADRLIQGSPSLVEEKFKDQNFALDLALDCDDANKLHDFIKLLLLKGATKCSKLTAEEIINNHASKLYRLFPENAVMLRQSISIIASSHNIIINEESLDADDDIECVDGNCDTLAKRVEFDSEAPVMGRKLLSIDYHDEEDADPVDSDQIAVDTPAQLSEESEDELLESRPGGFFEAVGNLVLSAFGFFSSSAAPANVDSPGTLLSAQAVIEENDVSRSSDDFILGNLEFQQQRQSLMLRWRNIENYLNSDAEIEVTDRNHISGVINEMRQDFRKEFWSNLKQPASASLLELFEADTESLETFISDIDASFNRHSDISRDDSMQALPQEERAVARSDARAFTFFAIENRPVCPVIADLPLCDAVLGCPEVVHK